MQIPTKLRPIDGCRLPAPAYPVEPSIEAGSFPDSHEDEQFAIGFEEESEPVIKEVRDPDSGTSCASELDYRESNA